MTTSSPSQDVQAKAGRYLLEGKVRVLSASVPDRSFLAEVAGRQMYLVLHIAAEWYCGCPACGACCHILACQAIWKPA